MTNYEKFQSLSKLELNSILKRMCNCIPINGLNVTWCDLQNGSTIGCNNCPFRNTKCIGNDDDWLDHEYTGEW